MSLDVLHQRAAFAALGNFYLHRPDALFVPDDGGGRASAELSPTEKDALSHRGRALQMLAPVFAALLAPADRASES